jgi:hypothetical protein
MTIKDVFVRRFLFLAVCLTALAAPAMAGDPPLKAGKCLLQVGGKTYIKGPCKYRMEGGGSFTVLDKAVPDWFAMVSVNGATADGFWNEDKGANHAHTPLGSLTRKGACWQNAKAKVCLWG